MKCIKVEKRDGYEIRVIRHTDFTHSRIYNRNGKILPRILLEGHIIDQMRAYKLLEKDLRNVIFWAEKSKEIISNQEINFDNNEGKHLENGLLLKGLFVSIVTIYGKCFTTANDRKFTLSERDVPEEYREFHKVMMHTRHNFAAHKGDYLFEECKVALVIDKKVKTVRVFSELQQPHFVTDSSERNNKTLIALCEELRKVLNQKYANADRKLRAEVVFTNKLDFWLKHNGQTVNINQFHKKK
jgi:hypothetical protein